MLYRDFFETHKEFLFSLMKDYYINYYSQDSSTINLSIHGYITPEIVRKIQVEGFSVDAIDYKASRIHFIKKL